MSDAALTRRNIEKLKQQVSGPGGDDAQGTRRAAIAKLYLDLGEVHDAAHWFVEAAKYAEWSENGLMAVAWAKRAAALAPLHLEARRELRRLWGKFGIEGEPPPE